MYLYLYDNFLNAPNYHKALARIEMRLTDLGIGGKICRISPLKNIKDLISDEIRFGIKTIIAVGNDETVSMVINNIADYDHITFGIIPIGKGNSIADSLGIPPDEMACDVISARRLEKLDLGKVNNTYFLSGISIATENQVALECENSYQIIPQTSPCTISICNLRPAMATAASSHNTFNPQDGFLEAYIQPVAQISNSFFGFLKKSKVLSNTIIPFKKISVLSKKAVTVTTDGKKVLKPPVEIEVVPKKLSVIVGKERTI